MRLRLLLCLAAVGIILSAVPVLAQDAIPVYPGCKAEFELNLTQKDFLPVLRQWIGIIPGAASAHMGSGQAGEGDKQSKEAAAMAEEIAKEVQAALAGVNQVSVVAYTQPKSVSVDKIMDFYVDKMGLDKGWTRTLMLSRPEGSAELYVKPDLMAMFAIGVGQGYVAASKVDGKVDLVALGRIFAKYAPMLASDVHVNIGGNGNGESQDPGQDGYEVILNAVGPQKVRVLGIIRDETGMTPTEAREFVQSLPKSLAGSLSKEEADDLASRLKSIGATVEVKQAE